MDRQPLEATPGVPVFDAAGWPGNGPAWHSLTDGQVLRAWRAIVAPGGILEAGRARWMGAAARWQVVHRIETQGSHQARRHG